MTTAIETGRIINTYDPCVILLLFIYVFFLTRNRSRVPNLYTFTIGTYNRKKCFLLS